MNTVVDACVPIDPEQFHRVLAIELGTSIEYSPSAAQDPDGTAVRLDCAAAGVQLQLQDNLTSKSMQRVVELPDADISTRSRLLALSVAEFVVASWVELHLGEPPVAAAGPVAPPEARQHASNLARKRLPKLEPREPALSVRHRRWLLGVSAGPVLFANSGWMTAVSVHVEERPSPQLAVALALSLGHANWSVRWPAEVIGAAGITSSSARLSLSYVAALDAFELSAGAGARGGIVHMAGLTDRAGPLASKLVAGELYAPWGGPVMLLSAAVLLGGLRIGLDLEVGYVTLAAQALLRDRMQAPTEGSIVVELRGVWAAGGLFLGWRF